MGETTIQWTDKTWNPVTGCTKVSPGCKYCYAERVSLRTFAHQTVIDDDDTATIRKRLFTDVVTHSSRLDQPLHWRKPQRIFVNSMSDLFHEDVPFEFIDKCFAVMALTPQHTYQILTKRPERMLEYFSDLGLRQEMIGIEAEYIGGIDRFVHPNHEPWRQSQHDLLPRWKLPFFNVWIGVSVENQPTYVQRWPLLRATPASVRFLSVEPMLEEILLQFFGSQRLGEILPDWVIVGGESGQKARPMQIDWARSVRKQCKAANVPFFMKQYGRNPMIGDEPYRLELDRNHGGNMDEWHVDMRVREFPRAEVLV